MVYILDNIPYYLECIRVCVCYSDSPVGRQDSSVISRQQAIGEHYSKLLTLVAERRKRLEDAIRQFKLFRDCGELESWIKEKGSGREKVEAMHKKFEVQFTQHAVWVVLYAFVAIVHIIVSMMMHTGVFTYIHTVHHTQNAHNDCNTVQLACLEGGTPNLYFSSEVLAISTG